MERMNGLSGLIGQPKLYLVGKPVRSAENADAAQSSQHHRDARVSCSVEPGKAQTGLESRTGQQHSARDVSTAAVWLLSESVVLVLRCTRAGRNTATPALATRNIPSRINRCPQALVEWTLIVHVSVLQAPPTLNASKQTLDRYGLPDVLIIHTLTGSGSEMSCKYPLQASRCTRV